MWLGVNYAVLIIAIVIITKQTRDIVKFRKCTYNISLNLLYAFAMCAFSAFLSAKGWLCLLSLIALTAVLTLIGIFFWLVNIDPAESGFPDDPETDDGTEADNG
ncbi:hypothetical protein A2303_03230 [Candidatus Falkowbacteria bacterium RIFOXYB2_FULL_47_14]|uniref:Uncharacterized protein n=1 Tax=Candidatus Falkowbacteria bacterium RIFOXYA2_FULL_47_19 TaxID=1797994 RepID=A0A1F5SF10_9BACT|nr:MAG: hypothetical protein A2227_07745 [Candidatus Falkowbacteria bacterium RIFOXYA2_FULL_47_19]OGF35199.1 MAG: hypothetical protein A2468_02065 [Candidatus Falkowbacteria bacterium RIFOXYC2_FULL_46_15]OGF43364.1 MAG: hypothetical protein A2303_03230 [Candidatus Falkowbacteria bacterium RIFOXYB2_FULL_47_14]